MLHTDRQNWTDRVKNVTQSISNLTAMQHSVGVCLSVGDMECISAWLSVTLHDSQLRNKNTGILILFHLFLYFELVKHTKTKQDWMNYLTGTLMIPQVCVAIALQISLPTFHGTCIQLKMQSTYLLWIIVVNQTHWHISCINIIIIQSY